MKSIAAVFKNEKIRKQMLFMLICVLIIRAGSQIPIPGLDHEAIRSWFNAGNDGFRFMDILSGGSLSNMSIFALSITPFISSSIIIELLSVVFPTIAEWQKEGEDGRKKKANASKYIGLAVAGLQTASMLVAFARRGLMDVKSLPIITTGVILMAGASFLLWLGDRLTERGLGNGISFILTVNIIARIPDMIITLYEQFVKGQTIAKGTMTAVIILTLMFAVIAFVVLLESGERSIPITNSSKSGTYFQRQGAGSSIPLKVNMAGVMPVIFAATILNIPGMIVQFTGTDNKVATTISSFFTESSWFSGTHPWYTLGLVIEVALIFFFAFFYTDITFNPKEVADNLRKSGSMIPGIRPGKSTEDYLNGVLRGLIPIGAAGLAIITAVPLVLSGVFHANTGMGGTSIIIVTGVLLEIGKEIESEMAVRYSTMNGFLAHNKGGIAK